MLLIQVLVFFQASDAEVGQLQFTFPSPPSRSASSNALADMAASSALPQGNSLFSVNPSNSAILPPSISAQSAADHGSLCSKDLPSQAASTTILFSASRTLPEVRPPLNSFSVSYPTTQKSTTTKRALPQDSWRCESCLAENAFLTSACRTCQRSPSSVVVDAQRKWHVEVNTPSSSVRNKIGEELPKKKLKCEKCFKIIEGNAKLCDTCVQCNEAVKDKSPVNNDLKWKCDSCNLLNDNRCTNCSGCEAQNASLKPNFAISLLKMTNDGLPKWRCDVCLVENDENKEMCICCQSPKPKSSKSAPEVKNVQDNVSKWRCDTCLVENDKAKENCVCCEGPKPKKAIYTVSPIIKKGTEKWQCETCLVENDSDKTQCVCCQGSKPLSLASKVGGVEKWRCDTCLIENDSTKERCCACEAEKPKQKIALVVTSSGKWQCETCLVENEASLDKCVCCESVNPKKKGSQVPITSNGPNRNIFESGGLLSSWKSSTNSQFKFGSSVSQTAFGEDSQKKTSNNVVQNDSNKPAFAFGGASERSEIKFGSSNGGIMKFGSASSEIKFGSATSSTIKFGSANSNETKIGAPNSSNVKFGAFNGAGLQTNMSSSETKGLIVPSNGPTFSFGAPNNNCNFGINNPEVKVDSHKDASQSKPSKTDVCTNASASVANTVLDESNVSQNRAVESQSSNSLFGKKDDPSGFNFKMDKADTIKKSPFTSNPGMFMFGNKESSEPSKPTNIPSTSTVLPQVEVGAKTHDSAVCRKKETPSAASNFGGRNLFGGNDSLPKTDNAWLRPNFIEDKGADGIKPSAISLNHFPLSQTSETKSGPPSTSIDSLFTNSSKVSLKSQDTKVLSFGKPVEPNTTDSSLFSGFASDAKQQKRMVSSVSSPSLNAFGAANNFGSGATIPNFGQPSAPNSSGSGFNFNKASSAVNSANEHVKEKTALPMSFGKSNSNTPFVFSKLPEQNPANIFGSTSQATSAPESTPSQTGASGIFGNNAGSTPFVFLGASSDSNTSTVQNAQSVPVISTNFQFGQQVSFSLCRIYN